LSLEIVWGEFSAESVASLKKLPLTPLVSTLASIPKVGKVQTISFSKTVWEE